MGLLAPKIHDLCQLLFTLSITGFWKTGEASLIIVCNCEQIEPVFLLVRFVDRLSGVLHSCILQYFSSEGT
jgi:hypothetical protein